MNESFKTDPSLATSARAAKESGSYLCASNVTPTAVRFIVSVFLCVLCSCRMSSTQMTCSHFRKNRPKKRQKPAGCRSRIISKNRPVPIFGRCIPNLLIFIIIFKGVWQCDTCDKHLPKFVMRYIWEISACCCQQTEALMSSWFLPICAKIKAPSTFRNVSIVILHLFCKKIKIKTIIII